MRPFGYLIFQTLCDNWNFVRFINAYVDGETCFYVR
jgi:hypothetical protein